MGSIVSRALPGHGTADGAAHSIVMPGLGPGIHEFRGVADPDDAQYAEKTGSSPRSSRGKLVDARAKPWHDDRGGHRLRAEPLSPGLGPGVTRECAAMP